MPSGGHNRKPKEEKIIQGTFRPAREAREEPEPRILTEIPDPPAHLTRYAKKAWKSLAVELVDLGLLTALDLITLEILCVNYGIYRELYDAVYTEAPPGELFTTAKKGRTRRTLAAYMQHRNSQTMPEYTAMTKAFATYKSLMAEFGLSPVARGRIDVTAPEKHQDPMEEILDGD